MAITCFRRNTERNSIAVKFKTVVFDKLKIKYVYEKIIMLILEYFILIIRLIYMAKSEVPDQTPPWKGGGWCETALFAVTYIDD